MPNQTILVENMGKITLTDKDYLAQGGEASIYTKDKVAYKIYHDPSKMISVAKIEELALLSPSNVLCPQNVVRSTKNKPIGYSMAYKKKTHPLCKLFTRSFRSANGVTEKDIIAIVTEIQKTLTKIHQEGFLVVDMNELNLLVSDTFKTPYFIDVDSFQTPSFKATAIMDSIRDRSVKNNQFTNLSDWFSFAVIAFQMYVGIHPYKGKHPDYKPNQWSDRMDDGVSVFAKGVTLPKVCNSFSVIPKPHLDWFKSVFLSNKRSVPPMADMTSIVIPIPQITIESGVNFMTELIGEFPDNILRVFNFMGVNYFMTYNCIYKQDHTKPLNNDINDYKSLLCESGDMTPVICKLKDDILLFEEIGGKEIGNIAANDMMYRDGAIYSVHGGKLTENTFSRFGNKILHKVRVACNVLELSTKVFDGVIFQDLIGKCHITLPYTPGKCLFKAVPELNGYRILEARAEGNICGVMAERKGVYYRFTLIFDDNFTNYVIGVANDVQYGPINLTVMGNGVCVMSKDPDVSVFKGEKGKTIADPPFDSNMRVYNASGGIFFIDGKKVYSAKMK